MVGLTFWVLFILCTVCLIARDAKKGREVSATFVLWQAFVLLSAIFVFGHKPSWADPQLFDATKNFVFCIGCMPGFVYFLKKFFQAKNEVVSNFDDFWRFVLGLSSHPLIDNAIICGLAFINVIAVVWTFSNLAESFNNYTHNPGQKSAVAASTRKTLNAPAGIKHASLPARHTSIR